MHEDEAHGLTRRRFLGAAGAAAAGAAGLSLLPGSMRKALAATPEQQLHSLDQIEHVLILMQENRSFDHYFGTLKGVRGLDDPHAMTLSTGRSVFYQPDPQNPDGYLLPFHNDTKTTSAAKAYGTDHSWKGQHLSWNDGRMDNRVPTHRTLDGPVRGPFTMGYYTRDDLPFQYALADAFTVCDNYFCSVLGPTHPNRVTASTAPSTRTASSATRSSTTTRPHSGGPPTRNACRRPGSAGGTAPPTRRPRLVQGRSRTPSPASPSTRTRWCRTRRRRWPT